MGRLLYFWLILRFVIQYPYWMAYSVWLFLKGKLKD